MKDRRKPRPKRKREQPQRMTFTLSELMVAETIEALEAIKRNGKKEG